MGPYRIIFSWIFRDGFLKQDKKSTNNRKSLGNLVILNLKPFPSKVLLEGKKASHNVRTLFSMHVTKPEYIKKLLKSNRKKKINPY